MSTSFYVAGEIIGGLFFHNDISGTGLTSVAVFGHIAGGNATRRAKALMGL